jgi:DNA excision repair protein ERCC-4
MKRPSIPAELPPEAVPIVIDEREQLPYDPAPMRSVPGTLAAGDYSVLHLEHRIAVERKSLPDFVSCCGPERERFERELQRLLGYETRAVVVEASWADLERGDWRSKMQPAAVVASVASWIGWGIPIVMAGNRASGQLATMKILYYAARRHWRTARGLAAGIINAETGIRE